MSPRVPTVSTIFGEITSITEYLVTKSLVDDQNFPIKTQPAKDVVEVSYPQSSLARSSTLTPQPYSDTYHEQLNARAFNLKMLDGALIQISYAFEKANIAAARLAYLPSPDLVEYQNDPELYEQDEMFAEVVDRRVSTVPFRFDFDPGRHIDIHHPSCHLTLGMFKNCRIATVAAPTPGLFVDFILRSFYNTALRKLSDGLPKRTHRFRPTITAQERQNVHIGVPH